MKDWLCLWEPCCWGTKYGTKWNRLELFYWLLFVVVVLWTWRVGTFSDWFSSTKFLIAIVVVVMEGCCSELFGNRLLSEGSQVYLIFSVLAQEVVAFSQALFLFHVSSPLLSQSSASMFRILSCNCSGAARKLFLHDLGKLHGKYRPDVFISETLPFSI